MRKFSEHTHDRVMNTWGQTEQYLAGTDRFDRGFHGTEMVEI